MLNKVKFKGVRDKRSKLILLKENFTEKACVLDICSQEPTAETFWAYTDQNWSSSAKCEFNCHKISEIEYYAKNA